MQKPIIFTIVLASLTLFSNGQNFPDSTAIWSYFQSDMFGTWRYTQYYQDADTSIGNKTYKKLHRSKEIRDSYNDTILFAEYNEYMGALRSEDSQKKVYLVLKDSINEMLLYDFNLEVGDTVPIWHNNFSHIITVEEIDTIIVDGKSLRAFEMNTNLAYNPVNEHLIIEGIGSLRDLLYIENYLEGTYTFECFNDLKTNIKYPEQCNSVILSSGPEYTENSEVKVLISPNPCSDYFRVSFVNPRINNNNKLEIIDLNGKLVLRVKPFNVNQTVDTKNIENGMYLLNIYEEGQIISSKKVLIRK